jgi:hypothetical protein
MFVACIRCRLLFPFFFLFSAHTARRTSRCYSPTRG